MFCPKCGSSVPDGAAFCPKCGATMMTTQQASAAPPAPEAMPQRIAPSAQAAGEIAVQQARKINIGKVVQDIIWTIIPAFIILIILNVVGYHLLEYNVLDHLLGLICGCLLLSILFSIPEVIVIMLRIRDPNDTAYEIGSEQDEETNKKFKKKYQLFESIAEWVIGIFVVIIVIYSGYTTLRDEYPEEMQKLWCAVNSLIEQSEPVSFNGTQQEAQKRLESYFKKNSLPGEDMSLYPFDTELYTEKEREFYHFACVYGTEGEELHSDMLLVDKKTGDLLAYDINYGTGILPLDQWYQAVVKGEDPWLSKENSDRESKPASKATYYVNDLVDGPPTIILNSDGTCALLGVGATMMYYYYGEYETSDRGIVLHLAYDDGTPFDMSFDRSDNRLVYINSATIAATLPGTVFNKSEEMPDIVRYNPPYSEPTVVSSTTYLTEDNGNFSLEYTPTIILEPDGSCAFLVNFGEEMSYLYGEYELTPNGARLYLKHSDGSVQEVPMGKTANGLFYEGKTTLGFTQTGSRFYLCDEMPVSIQYNPPYLELLPSVYDNPARDNHQLVPQTEKEAEEYVRTYLREVLPGVSAPIECTHTENDWFYLSLNPDGMDTYALIVDKTTGEIFVIDAFGGEYTVKDWYQQVGHQYIP